MITDKVFLVTGCASGIGQNLADALVSRGAKIVATDLDFPALLSHAENRQWPLPQVQCRRLDVCDQVAWEAAIAAAQTHFGRIDVLVNVAGVLQPGWVHEVEESAVHRQIDVNLKGVVFGTQAVSAKMVGAGAGHIINIASMAGLAPIAGLAVYCATKYGVRGYSLAAAQELRKHGVRVTVVCPDAVKTPMFESQKNYEEAALTFSGPRVLSAQEITDALLGDILKNAPLEVFLPRRRGWLARMADMFPMTATALDPVLRRRGRARQRDYGEG